MKSRVLVVEDDGNLSTLLRENLSFEGFDVRVVADGLLAVEEARTFLPDLVVLDLMLPGRDGFELCAMLRRNGRTPILIVSARSQKNDKVRGLNLGADDYLVKPFAPTELLARVRALLRRAPATSPAQPIGYGDLSLEPLSREVRRGERLINLSPKEFDLLALFLRHPRQVLLRDQILEAVWGYDFDGNGNVLEVYVGYLRAKTEAGGEPRLIHTVRGVGYVLREELAGAEG